jgi:pyridoxal phosphate enzyme (YggS family)
MLIGPQNLPENLRKVRERIAAATATAGRPVDSVTLLAAGKSQPAETLRAAAALGIRDFGENYVQEGLDKIQALRDLGLTWHFIGHVQANKTRILAEHFDWVHGVDRLRIAERLSEQRAASAPALNICLQVNLAGEASKGGAGASEVPELARSIARLPGIQLRGLMALPPAEVDPRRQRFWFAQLRGLRDALARDGLALDTLSMGMTGDLEAAVLEGATIVRIGTALFGPRS